MSYLQTRVVSHSQRVCSLYKRAVRNMESRFRDRVEFRFQAVMIRAEFDKNKDEKDYVVAKKLLEMGEKKLAEDLHWQPLKFPDSPGGAAYDREWETPDWALDYWHPLEKAMFPDYFARREQRKKEYIEFYEKTYGKPEVAKSDKHH